jgi:hypothetical protein
VAHNHKVAGSNPAPATKKNPSAFWLGDFSLSRRQNSNLRLFTEGENSRRFGAVNEAKESTEGIFLSK